jgi:hypothetical protein
MDVDSKLVAEKTADFLLNEIGAFRTNQIDADRVDVVLRLVSNLVDARIIDADLRPIKLQLQPYHSGIAGS